MSGSKGAIVLQARTPEAVESRRWKRRATRAGLFVIAAPLLRGPRAWLALAFALVGSLGAASRFSPGDSDFSRRLSAGCEDVHQCRELELEAERRVERCWIGCGREAVERELARTLRYRAGERQAVREHYRQREAAERQRAEAARAQQLDEQRREREARQHALEREHARQLELERLRQRHVDRRAELERERRLGYFSRLSAEARAERLKHCHARLGTCDPLVVDLIEAALDDDERRRLAELNEKLLRHPPRAEADGVAMASAPPRS